MKVLVVGATGAIGPRIISRLVEQRHEVFGTTRSLEKRPRLEAMGAKVVQLDLLDRENVLRSVSTIRPHAIIHQATALSGEVDPRHFDRSFRATNELRTRGTDFLLEAAREAGVERFIAQSFTGWPNARTGGPVKTEDDPLDPEPLASMRETLEAIRHLERVVLAANGIVLRYGGFYGDPTDVAVALVRQRKFPLVGEGTGVWSFVHLDDAATATVLALEHGVSGIYNVVDDDPAPVREWLPTLASALGAKPPHHVPRWLARIVGGRSAVSLMTETRGSSNAKAKRELHWTLRYPSWRRGFVAAYRHAA